MGGLLLVRDGFRPSTAACHGGRFGMRGMFGMVSMLWPGCGGFCLAQCWPASRGDVWPGGPKIINDALFQKGENGCPSGKPQAFCSIPPAVPDIFGTIMVLASFINRSGFVNRDGSR
jgi:hypothetical protein